MLANAWIHAAESWQDSGFRLAIVRRFAAFDQLQKQIWSLRALRAGEGRGGMENATDDHAMTRLVLPYYAIHKVTHEKLCMSLSREINE